MKWWQWCNISWLTKLSWLVGLAVVVLAGCALNPSPPEVLSDVPAVNPGVPVEPITLEVWLSLDMLVPDPLFEELAADFERAYPNVNVNLHGFVYQSIPDRVRKALQVGDPPDVVQAHVTAMAAQGLAEPLDNLWDAWGAHDEFLPQAMEQVTWDRVKYGVPLDIYTLVLIYNKAHFDEAGLAYPDADYTWKQFAADAATLTRPDGTRYGVGFTTDPWHVFAWLAEAGGNLVAGDSFIGYRFTLDATANIEGLRFLTMMARNGYGPLPTTRPRDHEDPRKLFLAGKIAMFFGTPYDIHHIITHAPGFPIGVTTLPKTPAGASAASALGSTGLFIPRGSGNRQIAFEFMKWATSDRYGLAMARRLGRYPARSWLLSTPHFAGDPLLKPFLAQLESARPYILDAFPEAERAYADAIKAAFYGADPADALRLAQEEANQYAGRLSRGFQ